MKVVSRRLAVALLVVACAQVAQAQTAEDVVNKSLAATGGRAAYAKLKSRSTTGTITLSTPAGEFTGSIEVLNAVPNKARSLIKVDLTAVGAGPVTVDQRFDGKSGYAIDSLQGNHDITGGQLDTMRNSSFPNPFLNYKEMGMTVKLGDKEKVDGRDNYVLILEPTTGPVIRQYVDAETYLPTKSIVKIDVPQLGQEVELTTGLSDFRDVDGVKLPFLMKTTSPVQNYTIAVTKVEHNVPVDEALFSKPGTP